MIVSDFISIGSQDGFRFAEITVTESRGESQKHTIAKELAKEPSRWFFIKTGKFVPGSIVEELERAYYAQLKLKKLEHQN
jgi:hypothetical protein